MTGVEVCDGNDILFRIGVLDLGDYQWLYSKMDLRIV